MAVHLSKNAQISVGGTAIGQVTGIEWSETAGLIDTTNYDSTRREYASDELPDAEATIEVQWDLADTGQDAIRTALASGSAVEVIIYPEGNTTTKPKLTADAVIYDHQVSASGIDGVITGTFSAKFIEALAEGTVT